MWPMPMPLNAQKSKTKNWQVCHLATFWLVFVNLVFWSGPPAEAHKTLVKPMAQLVGTSWNQLGNNVPNYCLVGHQA